MALRLTGSTLESDGGSNSAHATGSSAPELARQARAMLAAGDLDGYGRLFGQAGELEEPQRRYQARVSLLGHGLIAAGEAPASSLATRLYVAVAGESLTLLEQEPCEPIMLNFAGIACYELWSLDAAQALFRATRRLDPALANIERNLAEVGRRKRSGARRTRPLHAAVPGLARRAASVATRARPASGLTLSLCMIVRDEEQMLARCLAAAQPAVDEIVVVDTGSTDATIEIARSFGARVIEHPWNGSFADARNVSIEAATGDWLFYLDADEVLIADDVAPLRALTGRTWREAFYVIETSYTGELGQGAAVTNNALRVFRNRPGHRFTGRVHEQIAPQLPGYAPGRIEHTPVRVHHYGYLDSVREIKEKSRRNVELLRQQAAESAPTSFLHFNLGSEYSAAGDPGSAVIEFERSWTMLKQEGNVESSEFAPSLLVRMAKAQLASGHAQAARSTAIEGLGLFENFTDLVFGQAAIALSLGDEAEAMALYRRCIELGDAPAKYAAMVGCGTFLPRVLLAQLHLGHDDVEAARPLLDWCIEHHPDFLGVIPPYATVRLRDGVPPAEVVAEVQRRLHAITPAVRCALAEALNDGGASAAAEDQYRVALAADPANATARLGLAELLLSRGAYAEAAQESALVPEGVPESPRACQLELCGRISGDDLSGARAVLGRSRPAGLPGAEREVFLAWTTVAEGAPAPPGLPLAGIPLLGVILQTLLRAGDFKRFAALVPALEQSQLARREQRELLAEIYLSQRMLGRAAAEWMAVCSEAPDARALLGLARVAAVNGMTDDALTFATGALELDPGSAAASALLSSLPAAAAPVGAL
jgi:tetratricopeptide (TPR) repeat protein